jgi:hypothetical protein
MSSRNDFGDTTLAFDPKLNIHAFISPLPLLSWRGEFSRPSIA